MITRAKIDSTHSRRVVFSYLQDKEAVTELFRDISVKVADRPGGYVRILKTGFRLGDNADMCIIELVDYNENLLTSKETTTKKTVRRRKPAVKKATDAAVETPVTAKTPKTKVVEETVAEEVVEVEEVVEQPVEDNVKETEADEK